MKINNIKKKYFENFLRRWDRILLSSFILIYAITFSTLSILRHNAFASNYDLANMSQTVWNTLNGRPFSLSGAEGTISRFSIHADLILILISPLYLIWERAMTLLVAQSFFLALGAVPVYFLTKKVLENSVSGVYLKIISLCLVVIYLLNPTMQWVNIYDFHGVALAVPFLLFTFYFAYIKRWKLFLFFAFLSMTTKEVSLSIAMLGLVIVFVFKEKVIGISAFILGILWFLLMIFFVMPYFSTNGEHWGLNNLYSPAIQKFTEIRSLTQFLDVLRGYFLIPSSLEYYSSLLKPFSYMPLIGFPWLILSLPEIAINLFSSNFQMRTTTFHYGSAIIPSLVISTIFGLKYLMKFIVSLKLLRQYKNYIFIITILFMVFVSVRINYHYSPLPTTPSCWCYSYQVKPEDREFAEVLSKIPKNASVTSSGEVRPHIARRENSFTLPGHVEDADYVAIIDENRIVGDHLPKEFENSLLKDQRFLQTHDKIYHVGHYYLFKKK